MTTKVFVPPIKIQGIKTKLVPLIKQNVIMGQDTLWVEPFMGSGVVGFNMKPNRAIFADINPFIVDFYNQIKNRTITSGIVQDFLQEEGEILAKQDDKHYYFVRDRFNKAHNPLDFLFLNRSCFNGMIRFNKNYEFNVPYGHKPERFSKAYITKIVNQVKYVEQCLTRYDWTFVTQDFETTLLTVPQNSFIYCDPPYIGRHVDYYDSWDEQSELRLCRSLQNAENPFMVSTWDRNAYRQNEYLVSVWEFCHKLTAEHFYFVGAKKANRHTMLEALLTNYIPDGKSNLLLDQDGQLCLDMFDLNINIAS